MRVEYRAERRSRSKLLPEATTLLMAVMLTLGLSGCGDIGNIAATGTPTPSELEQKATEDPEVAASLGGKFIVEIPTAPTMESAVEPPDPTGEPKDTPSPTPEATPIPQPAETTVSVPDQNPLDETDPLGTAYAMMPSMLKGRGFIDGAATGDYGDPIIAITFNATAAAPKGVASEDVITISGRYDEMGNWTITRAGSQTVDLVFGDSFCNTSLYMGLNDIFGDDYWFILTAG